MSLEQVEVGVHEFADGRPHYAWLPLAGRAAAGHMGGEVRMLLGLVRSQPTWVLQHTVHCFKASRTLAWLQVHLRLQWRENQHEADAEATATFSFEVRQSSCPPCRCFVGEPVYYFTNLQAGWFLPNHLLVRCRSTFKVLACQSSRRQSPSLLGKSCTCSCGG
jgi:hypothetical protein